MTSRLLLGIAALLVLAGCGGDDDSDTDASSPTPEVVDSTDDQDDAAGDAEPGLITIGDRTFTFNPWTCWVSDEDSEVNGPGREEGGDVVYVDFSGDGAGEGAVRIELGTDQAFETTEQHIMADRYASEPLTVTIDGLSVSATGVFLDENDELHEGTVEFSCD